MGNQSKSRTASDWIKFRNQLWEYLYEAKHPKFIKHLDSLSVPFLIAANQSCQDKLESSLRNCLQTLLYISWLKKTGQKEVILIGNIKVDINESSHVIFWKILQNSRQFIPDFSMTELVIDQKHVDLVKYILEKLTRKHDFSPTLSDGIPLLHIIIRVGHTFQRPDESIDLIRQAVTNNISMVDFICPWTNMSTLDLALERQLGRITCNFLYDLGCRAQTHIHMQNSLTEKKVAARVPSNEIGNPMNGLIKCNETLEMWKKSEKQFIDTLESEIVDKHHHIIDVVRNWMKESLREVIQHLPFQTVLRTSGSISEGTKIKPLDEIDFLLQCDLNISLDISDVNANTDWIASSTCEPSLVHQELEKIDSKQPFPYLAKVRLKQDYPGLGKKGSILCPERFSEFVDNLVSKTIIESSLPDLLKVPKGKILLERTRSGLFMNLEYESEGEKQELTLDLVFLLKLSHENYKSVLDVMPKYNNKKFEFLKENNLLSDFDGIIVKNDKWRMSFSNGEKKVIELHKNLYVALKYLSKCSEHHITIPTYYLKEIFCSFVVHKCMKNNEKFKESIKKKSLAATMAELIAFCEKNRIASPFYCTGIGSQLEKNCSDLFRKFREVFPEEFKSNQKKKEPQVPTQNVPESPLSIFISGSQSIMTAPINRDSKQQGV